MTGIHRLVIARRSENIRDVREFDSESKLKYAADRFVKEHKDMKILDNMKNRYGGRSIIIIEK